MLLRSGIYSRTGRSTTPPAYHYVIHRGRAPDMEIPQHVLGDVMCLSKTNWNPKRPHNFNSVRPAGQHSQ